VSTITSAIVSTVNLCIYLLGTSTCLTLRQNRMTSIYILSCILLPCCCSNFAQNVIINLFMAVITYSKFHRNPFSVLVLQSERNTPGRKQKTRWTEYGTEATKDKAKTRCLQCSRGCERHKNESTDNIKF